MIWFAPVFVFLAQALVLFNANICSTLDLATTQTFLPRLRLASVHLHDLICSSSSEPEDIIYAPATSEPVSWSPHVSELVTLPASEPVVCSHPASEPVAPVIVVPSPSRTVSCFVGKDACVLYSGYTPYSDGPTPLSSLQTEFSADVDDHDPVAAAPAPKTLSAETFKAQRPRPIDLTVYIGLAICCFTALLGFLIILSRVKSAHAKETPQSRSRRPSYSSNTGTVPDDGSTSLSFFVSVEPTTQFPYTDMIYEQAIASALAVLTSTISHEDNDDAFHGTVALEMESSCEGHFASVKRGNASVNTPLYSSDGLPHEQHSANLTVVEDAHSVSLGIGIHTSCTMSDKDVDDFYGSSSKKSATTSNGESKPGYESPVHTLADIPAAGTVPSIDPALVPLPIEDDELNCGNETTSLPALVENSGLSDLAGLASVTVSSKDGVGCLSATVNVKQDASHMKITFPIDPASVPLPEPLDDELAEALDSPHSDAESGLNAKGSASEVFIIPDSVSDVNETSAISTVPDTGLSSRMFGPSAVFKEHEHALDPTLIPLPEPSVDELGIDPADVPLPEDDSGLDFTFDSNVYYSSTAIHIAGTSASLDEDEDEYLLYAASVPLPEPTVDESEIGHSGLSLLKDESDTIVRDIYDSGTPVITMPSEASAVLTIDVVDAAGTEGPRNDEERRENLTALVPESSLLTGTPSRKFEEDERIVVPLGTSASIWARVDDSFERSEDSFRSIKMTSREDQDDPFKMSAHDSNYSMHSSRSGDPLSTGTPRRQVKPSRLFNLAMNRSVESSKKEVSSPLKPTTLRNAISGDSMVVPSQSTSLAATTPLRSRWTPRKVDENANSASPQPTWSRSAYVRGSPRDIREVKLTNTATPSKRTAPRDSHRGIDNDSQSSRKKNARGKRDTARGSPGGTRNAHQSTPSNQSRSQPTRASGSSKRFPTFINM
ncbi:hypothetical protein ACEPAF_1041 [Sanghuangporus sanghuang]